MFENMRFEIIKAPLFIVDSEGIVYENPAFSELHLRNPKMIITFPNRIPANDSLDGFAIVKHGKQSTSYRAAHYKTENGLFKMCIKASAVSEVFPVNVGDRLFFMLETYSEKLFVPAGGGAVLCADRDTVSTDAPVLETSGMYSDMFATYKSFSAVSEDFLTTFGNVLKRYGGSTEVTSDIVDNPICRFGSFDVSIILLLSAIMLIRETGSRQLYFALSGRFSEYCIASIAAENDCISAGRRQLASARFGSDAETQRIAGLIESFAELYGWKYFCSEGGGRLSLSLCLPRVNRGGISFGDSEREAFSFTGMSEAIIAKELEAVLPEYSDV